MNPPDLIEHFFRHEYGRMVSLLVSRVGVGRLEDVEDAVQSALLTALDRWTHGTVPHNPSAWLYQVARNRLLDQLRTRAHRNHLLETFPDEASPSTLEATLPADFDAFGDEVLQLLFVCADDRIPRESQIVLALKILCGFEVREIAPRLFTSEDNIHKRLQRARQRLRTATTEFSVLSDADLAARQPTVHLILYLIFTEGHLSVRQDAAVRRELCDEAIRLCTLLAEHPSRGSPETAALLAVFHFTAARLDARVDASGGLLLLEEQDRQRWNQDQIRTGLRWLNASASGEYFSRYHAEAAIAAEHATAPSFAATRWDRIAQTYAQLEVLAPSPLHTLNRALSVAEWQGPARGLEILQSLEAPSWLVQNHLWAAVYADLHRRCDHPAEAQRFSDLALRTAPNGSTRALLERRLYSTH